MGRMRVLASAASLLLMGGLLGGCAELSTEGGFAPPGSTPPSGTPAASPVPSSSPTPTSPAPTIFLVQSNSAPPSAVANLTVTLSSPVHAGDLIVAVAALSANNAGEGMGDSMGNSYVQSGSASDGSASYQVSFYFTFAATDGTLSVTDSTFGAAAQALVVAEFKGVPTSNGLPPAFSSGSGGGVTVGPPGSLAVGDLVVAAETHATSGGGLTTAGGGFQSLGILGESGTPLMPLAVEWQLSPAAPGAAQFTLSAAETWGAIAQAFSH